MVTSNVDLECMVASPRYFEPVHIHARSNAEQSEVEKRLVFLNVTSNSDFEL